MNQDIKGLIAERKELKDELDLLLEEREKIDDDFIEQDMDGNMIIPLGRDTKENQTRINEIADRLEEIELLRLGLNDEYDD